LVVTIPRVGGKQAGMFWPYLWRFTPLFTSNMLSLVRRLGMFTCEDGVQEEHYKHNCLTVALAHSFAGMHTPTEKAVEKLFKRYPDLARTILLHTNQGRFSKCHLALAARSVKGTVRVTYGQNGDNKKRATRDHAYKGSDRTDLVLHIGLIRGHYFCMTPLPVTKYAISRWWDIVGSDWRNNRDGYWTSENLNFAEGQEDAARASVNKEWTKSVGMRVGCTGAIQYRITNDKGRRCDSYTFFRLMLELQASKAMMIPLDSITLCHFLSHYQRCTLDTEEACCIAAMKVQPWLFTPILRDPKASRFEKKVTAWLYKHPDIKDRDWARKAVQDKDRRSRSKYGGGKELMEATEAVKLYSRWSVFFLCNHIVPTLYQNSKTQENDRCWDCETRGAAVLPFMIAIAPLEPSTLSSPLDTGACTTFRGPEVGNQMLRWLRLHTSSEDTVELYAHNATFDIRSVLLCVTLSGLSFSDLVYRGNSNSILSVKVSWKAWSCTFKDTYAVSFLTKVLVSVPTLYEKYLKQENNSTCRFP